MTVVSSTSRATSNAPLRPLWTHVDRRLWTASAAGVYVGRVEARHHRFRAIDRINGDLGSFDDLASAKAAVEAVSDRGLPF
jgi:hypothetical protein